MICWRKSSGDPRAKIPMVKTVPSDNLTLRVSVLSLDGRRSVGGMYGIGGRVPKCPFSHSESFNPLGVLEDVLILEER